METATRVAPVSSARREKVADAGGDARRSGALLVCRQQILVVVEALVRRRTPTEGAAGEQQVRDPERDAIKEEDRGAGMLAHRRRHLERTFDRGPGGRPHGAVRRDPCRHLDVVGLGGGKVGHAAAARLSQLRRKPLGEGALAAARAAGDKDESITRSHRSPPSRRCRDAPSAMVSWLALRPTGRAFPPSSGGIAAAFVGAYSCGAAPALHRLPDS